MSERVLNDRGEWVPAIPLPLYGVRKQCLCGRRFWTMEGYQGHYTLAHILGLSRKVEIEDRLMLRPIHHDGDQL